VEVQTGGKRAFGRGSKRIMSVASFLDMLGKGESTVYLSTQCAGADFDTHPQLLTPPLSCFPDFPKKPSVMGALVPQSINIWMGSSKSGTSSGLHHDFHDNLYVLMSGVKRFRLFPPSDAHRMYTHGVIDHIHSNGRYATVQPLPLKLHASVAAVGGASMSSRLQFCSVSRRRCCLKVAWCTHFRARCSAPPQRSEVTLRDG
jgi:hypothetical protein